MPRHGASADVVLFAPRPRATRVAFFDVGIPTRPPCLHIFFIISDTRVLSGRPAPARIARHSHARRRRPRRASDTATSHTVLKVQGESTTRARTSDFDPRR